MFKSKGAVYILIPINIFVWGFFIYRFYNAYNEYNLPANQSKNQDLKFNDIKDSVVYELSLKYNDPFLKEVSSNKETVAYVFSKKPENNVKSRINSVAQNKETLKPISEIKYFGLVKNTITGLFTALVSINGNSYVVKKGDVVEGVCFKNITNKDIEVKEGKTSRSVSKN